MNKIKWTFMTLAILLSIGGAFATRPRCDCSFAPQYYFNGASYNLAGQLGVQYNCWVPSANTCTYTTSDGVHFIPCQIGNYQPVPQFKK
jgi:hypothetical protein